MTLGEIAYNAYCEARAWKSVRGERLPHFKEQSRSSARPSPISIWTGMSYYNMERRTSYGIEWHWRQVEKRTLSQLKLTNLGLARRARLGRRLEKAKVQILASVLSR